MPGFDDPNNIMSSRFDWIKITHLESVPVV
jgi:hypothetical protein